MPIGRLHGAGKPVARREPAVLGEGVQRRVPGGLDAIRFELVAKAIARPAVGQEHRKGEVRGALHRLIAERELDPGDLRKPLTVGANDRAPRRDALLQPTQAA